MPYFLSKINSLLVVLAFAFTQMTFSLNAMDLKLSEAKFMLGEPIDMEINVVNTTSVPILCSLSPDPMSAVSFSLVQGDRTAVRVLNPSSGMGGLQAADNIPRNGSKSYSYFLSDYVLISKPGIYTFKVDLAEAIMPLVEGANRKIMIENEKAFVTVEIVSGDANSLRSEIATLCSQLQLETNRSIERSMVGKVMRFTDTSNIDLISALYLQVSDQTKKEMINLSARNSVAGPACLKEFAAVTSEPRLLQLIKEAQSMLLQEAR